MIKEIEFKCRWIRKVLIWEGEKDMCKCSSSFTSGENKERINYSRDQRTTYLCVWSDKFVEIYIILRS
jgi:hypothetical protein